MCILQSKWNEEPDIMDETQENISHEGKTPLRSYDKKKE